VSDETPRFRLIKGGALRFSTDHLLQIDGILRDRLQPITRYGWVIDAFGNLVSSCGGPVAELTERVRQEVAARSSRLPTPEGILTGVSVMLPPPDAAPCPLVLIHIEPLGTLVATCMPTSLSASYEAALKDTAARLEPIFDDARVPP
jgi:hypothetical protein